MRSSSAFPKRLLTSAVVLLLAFTPAFSQAPQDELAKLKQENQQLREENQRLRNLLIQRQASTPLPYAPPARSPATVPAPPPVKTGAVQGAPLDHWLTLSSSKRHNSSCRYFHNSNGRPCTKDEGIACKICG